MTFAAKTKLALYPLLNKFVINRLAAVKLTGPIVSGAKSILVVRLDAVGDMVLSTPVFRELRRLEPEAHITAIVLPKSRELLEASPDVDTVLTYEAPEGLRQSPLKHIDYLRRFAEAHLASTHWSVALNLRSTEDIEDASFLCYLSRADRRIGFSEDMYSEKALRNAGYDALYTEVIGKGSAPLHERDRALSILRRVLPDALTLCPTIPISESQRDEALSMLGPKFRDRGADRITIAFALGAGNPRRIWPVQNFIELARQLVKQYDALLILTGGRDEIALGTAVADELAENAIDITGKCTLTQTAAIFSLADLFVGSDSGPAHIAAASGPALVVLSCHPAGGDEDHANSPLRFGPLAEKATVLQPSTPLEPCRYHCQKLYPHCITNIGVQEVYAAVVSMIEDRATVVAAQT